MSYGATEGGDADDFFKPDEDDIEEPMGDDIGLVDKSPPVAQSTGVRGPTTQPATPLPAKLAALGVLECFALQDPSAADCTACALASPAPPSFQPPLLLPPPLSPLPSPSPPRPPPQP